ncbi:MAG: hypothetical protein HQ559_07330 [Lentisphaerae bacterium]|nr:hypothetical protein [Lentisphaerota bacterium]
MRKYGLTVAGWVLVLAIGAMAGRRLGTPEGRAARHAAAVLERRAAAAEPGTSGHAYVRFKALVQNTLGVTINGLNDLPGKADDILIAANQRLTALEADMAAASTLGQYKTANQAMSLFQADLDRINLFMWAIQIRRQAGM